MLEKDAASIHYKGEAQVVHYCNRSELLTFISRSVTLSGKSRFHELLHQPAVLFLVCLISSLSPSTPLQTPLSAHNYNSALSLSSKH